MQMADATAGFGFKNFHKFPIYRMKEEIVGHLLNLQQFCHHKKTSGWRERKKRTNRISTTGTR
jgi:hypothetical protein